MRKSLQRFLLLPLFPSLLLICPTPGWAQVPAESPVKLVLSVVGGLSAASGDAADSYKLSYSVGGEADITLADLWALTISGVYNEAASKYTTSTEKATVIELGANFKYIISPTPVVHPHIRFGAALYDRSSGSSFSETNFGINGGLGVDFLLPGSPVGFTASARYHQIFVTSTSYQNPSWQYFNLWGGVRFKVL